MADKQLSLPLGRLSSQQFAPIKEAAEYTRMQGRKYKPVDPQLQVKPDVGHAVMLEYRKRYKGLGVPSEPASDNTKRSFEALKSETNDQYRFMTEKLGVKHEVVPPSRPDDEYLTAQDMHSDVLRNNRLKTGSSEGTGGHPLGDEFNDKFRAVHDYFGHLATGRGFSRHGEEAAYQSHRQMYSPHAREALTSETRGQNSYLNYHPKWSEFPDQSPDESVIGMPRWAQAANPSLGRLRGLRRSPEVQGSQESLF